MKQFRTTACLQILCRVLLLAVLWQPIPALADWQANDIQWYALGRPLANDTGKSPVFGRIHQLSNELFCALLPNPWGSASSLGVSAFAWQLQGQLSPIPASTERWLRSGLAPNPLFPGSAKSNQAPDAFTSLTLAIRKGLPLSTDLGFSASLMPQSQLALISGLLRMTLLESHQDWLPSLAIGIGGHHLLGAEQIWMAAGELQGAISYRFTAGSWLELVPVINYSHIFAAFEGQLIDLTPESVSDLNGDQLSFPQGSLYSAPQMTWQSNQIQRISVGLTFGVAPVSLGYLLHLTLHPKANQRLLLSHGINLHWLL